MKERINEQLGVLKEGEPGATEEIHLGSMSMEGDEETVALEEGEDKDPLEAEPERADVAITAAGEVGLSIMQDMQNTLGAELLEGEEVNEDLAAPA